MKSNYPIYKSNRLNPQSEQVYNSLSKKNKDAIKKFLNESSIKSKSKTRSENRKRALIRLFDFLEKDYDKITHDDYVKLAKAISESSLGVYTKNDDKDFIKRFLKDNYSDWRKKFNDFKLLSSEIKTEEDKLTHRNLLTDIELDKLIKSTADMKHKALLSVLDESASRPEEILKLKWSDVDLKKKIIYLFSIKTKKKRAVPLNQSINHLLRLKNESSAGDEDYIFFLKDKKKKMNNSTLNQMLKILCKKAGIKKNVYPYIFRHTRLSKLITKLSPKVYEDIAGHSLSMGIKTYAHLSQDKIISEMREKVYEIEELTLNEKKEFEKKIDDLNDKFNYLTKCVKVSLIPDNQLDEKNKKTKKAVINWLKKQ